MTEEQEAHLRNLGQRFIQFVEPKYRAGQKEHGGDIWDMSAEDLTRAIKEEVADLWVYIDTLEMKLNGKRPKEL